MTSNRCASQEADSMEMWESPSGPDERRLGAAAIAMLVGLAGLQALDFLTIASMQLLTADAFMGIRIALYAGGLIGVLAMAFAKPEVLRMRRFCVTVSVGAGILMMISMAAIGLALAGHDSEILFFGLTAPFWALSGLCGCITLWHLCSALSQGSSILFRFNALTLFLVVNSGAFICHVVPAIPPAV